MSAHSHSQRELSLSVALALTSTLESWRQERLAAMRREQEREAVRECSFRPAINGRSSRLMSDRSTVLKVPGCCSAAR